MSKTTQETLREVFIVDGLRTPFIKAANKPNSLSAADLAVAAGKTLLARQKFPSSEINEVVIGCVCPSADETNIGRIIALRLGCGQHVMGYTVQRNCASGLQALDSAAKDIALGRHDLVLAGGTEAMSRAPLLFADNVPNWLAELNMAKTWQQKLCAISKFKLNFLKPVISLLKGLTDPIVGLSMGQTAEILAYRHKFNRELLDEFAVNSHLKAHQAIEAGNLAAETTMLADWQGNFFANDNGVRADSAVAKLAKLKPVFDKPFGKITAGNSSQITDGASLLILASKEIVKKHNLPVLGKIIACQWSALKPEVMGLGPSYAIADLLRNQSLSMNDIDYWEINEAFAAQVMACVESLQDIKFCREQLNWETIVGKIPLDKLNIDGGAIAIGHPVGASGARLPLHMLHILKRNNARRGIVSLCIGGGQGGAMLIERINEV